MINAAAASLCTPPIRYRTLTMSTWCKTMVNDRLCYKQGSDNGSFLVLTDVVESAVGCRDVCQVIAWVIRL